MITRGDQPLDRWGLASPSNPHPILLCVIEPERRRKRRADYKRWERSRSMELWQMDIVGGVRLADGQSASIVSGIDDHSRFVVCAQVVARATARPVCDPLATALTEAPKLEASAAVC